MKIAAFLTVVFFVGCKAELTVMVTDYTALYGRDALIPCTYAMNGITGDVTLTWSVINGGSSTNLCKFLPATSQVTPYTAASSRNISCSTTDGALVIPAVTFDDSETYRSLKCEVDVSPVDSKEGEVAFEVVSVADEEPVVNLQQNEFSLSSESANVGTCASGYAKPPPKVQFFRGDTEIVSDEAGDDGTESEEDSFSDYFTSDSNKNENELGEMTVQKTLILNLTKDDDNADFYCVVTSGFGPTQETNSVQRVLFEKFRVQYPTDDVTIEADKPLAFVGETVSFTCNANGYPQPTIRFEDITTTGNTASYDLNVSKADKDRLIECRASNLLTTKTKTDTYLVNPLYADEPTIEGKTVVNYGDEISLECNSVSQPEALTIKWRKGENAMSETKTLSIAKADFSHAGVYTCVVENEYDKLNREKDSMEVVVNALMIDGPTEVDVSGEPKKTVDFECTVMSNTAPTITWTKSMGGEEEPQKVDSNGPVENAPNTYTSKITIGPLDSSYSHSKYVCTGNNENNQQVTKTFSLPSIAAEASSAAPAIIIVILVVVLLIAVVLAVLYKKGIVFSGGKKGDKESMGMDPKESQPKDVEAGKAVEEAPAEEMKLMNGSENQ